MSNIDNLNITRLRGVARSPYQTCYPAFTPPIASPLIPPLPSPPGSSFIIINHNQSSGSGESQDLIDYKQNQSIVTISARLEEVAALITETSGISLGILSSQAYPGNEGNVNRTLITNLMNNMVVKDDLNEYVVISSMTENLDVLNSKIPTEISSLNGYDELITNDEISSILSSNYTKKDELQSELNNIILSSEIMSSTVSSIVNQIVSNDIYDFTELTNSINSLNIKI